jgi:hypothetical protein
MSLTEELAAAAARLVVEEGLEYGPAKRRAARVLGRSSVRPAELPSNDAVEEEVRAYLELFCADTHPAELAALREVAALWMERLAEFRPHLSGAAWRGTATRLSAVHVDLFCDDAKAAEIVLINKGVDYDATGSEDDPVLTVASRSDALGDMVTVHLHVRDLDDLRGALKPDARGRSQRGDLAALRRLMDAPPVAGSRA